MAAPPPPEPISPASPQPPQGPGTPPPYPHPGPYAPPYAPLTPPPTSGTRTLLIVVGIIVAVIVVLVVVAIVIVGNFLGGVSGHPVVTFSQPAVAAGNASFSVQAVTIASSCSNFMVHLSVGMSSGSDVVLGCNGLPVLATVGATTYLVTWTDVDGSGTVSAGDRFAVTGNGVRLPVNQNFVFYLDWTSGGAAATFSGVTSWTT